MHVPEIKNLKISQVTPNIWLVHQIETPFYFSCCDGLIILPKKDRNKKTVVIDLNILITFVHTVTSIILPMYMLGKILAQKFMLLILKVKICLISKTFI
ncbi:MAG: hypothetical protein ACTSSM_15480 [Promethearchaeota archaeon]